MLEPHANLGYARAANLGIAATHAPVVAVVNPDTVLAPGLGRRGRRRGVRRRPALAAVGPQILNPDGTVYPSARATPGGRRRGGPRAARPDPAREPLDPRPTSSPTRIPASPATSAWVSGAMVWFRRGWLDRVGGWDERFFLFLEDVDVCRSVGEAGGRVRYEPRRRGDPPGRGEPLGASRPLGRRPPPVGLRLRREVVGGPAPGAAPGRGAVPRRCGRARRSSPARSALGGVRESAPVTG